MNEAFEKWWTTSVADWFQSLSSQITIDRFQKAFEAGQSSSAARIAELEADNERLKLINEGMYARNDGMHKQLAELTADCKAMAGGLVDTHWPGRYTIACEDCHRRKVLFAKTCTELECREAQQCSCPACLIAAKYK